MKKRLALKPSEGPEPWTRSHTFSAASLGATVCGLFLGYLYFHYNAELAGGKRAHELARTSTAQTQVAKARPSSIDTTVAGNPDRGLRFDQIVVGASIRLDPALIVRALPIRAGDNATPSKIGDAIDALTFAAARAGYAFVGVEPRYEINATKKTVDVTFDVAEGARVYVDHVDIIGDQPLGPVVVKELGLVSENQGLVPD